MRIVGQVVRSCSQYCDEVIVIDDASTDGTSAVSGRAGALVIRNNLNSGIVWSTEVGLRSASRDIIVTLDADGQHDPSEIPAIVQPITQGLADLVLGKRDSGRPLSERIISYVTSLRVKCKDVGTGYRAFRKDLAHKIRLWGFCLCRSLVHEAWREGARITEVAITVRPRRFGKVTGHSHCPGEPCTANRRF